MSVASFLLPAQTTKKDRMTFEAYYAAEQKAETRSEFIDGVVRSMAGANEGHIAVVSTLGELVGPALRQRGECRFRTQDTQIPIPAHNIYT